MVILDQNAWISLKVATQLMSIRMALGLVKFHGQCVAWVVMCTMTFHFVWMVKGTAQLVLKQMNTIFVWWVEMMILKAV